MSYTYYFKFFGSSKFEKLSHDRQMTAGELRTKIMDMKRLTDMDLDLQDYDKKSYYTDVMTPVPNNRSILVRRVGINASKLRFIKKKRKGPQAKKQSVVAAEMSDDDAVKIEQIKTLDDRLREGSANAIDITTEGGATPVVEGSGADPVKAETKAMDDSSTFVDDDLDDIDDDSDDEFMKDIDDALENPEQKIDQIRSEAEIAAANETSSNGGRRAPPNRPVPAHYVCPRCNAVGLHFKESCPSVDDAAFIPPTHKIQRKTKGVPLIMLQEREKPLDDDDPTGNILVGGEDGKLYEVTSLYDTDTLRADKKSKVEIPEHFACPICAKKIMISASKMSSCCGGSACDKCLRKKLSKSQDAPCPLCNATNVSIDDVEANEKLRGEIDTFRTQQKKSAKWKTSNIASYARLHSSASAPSSTGDDATKVTNASAVSQSSMSGAGNVQGNGLASSTSTSSATGVINGGAVVDNTAFAARANAAVAPASVAGPIFASKNCVTIPTIAAPDSKELCNYFLQGRCFSGINCKYVHRRPPTSGPPMMMSGMMAPRFPFPPPNPMMMNPMMMNPMMMNPMMMNQMAMQNQINPMMMMMPRPGMRPVAPSSHHQTSAAAPVKNESSDAKIAPALSASDDDDDDDNDYSDIEQEDAAPKPVETTAVTSDVVNIPMPGERAVVNGESVVDAPKVSDDTEPKAAVEAPGESRDVPGDEGNARASTTGGKGKGGRNRRRRRRRGGRGRRRGARKKNNASKGGGNGGGGGRVVVLK
eukprot:g831.t1